MIRIINTPLLLLLCLVMSVGIISSCKKNDDVASGQVQLLSFGPTGAQPGDTLRFIGNNLHKVTAIDLTGASVPQASFIQQTPGLILIIVPEATEQGRVTLKTPEGDVVSKTSLNLEIAIDVTSITSKARPGENITITGDYLNWVERVTFADDKVVDSFVSQSKNELVVTVPLDARTGPLVIFYAGTDSADMQTEDTLLVTLPMATSLSPNPIKHAENVSITGTDLDLVKKVIFTGVSTPVTTFVSQSATQLVLKVPAETGKGAVTLEAASGVQTTSNAELDVVLPAISNMTPNPVDPGANLTITGTNLDLVDSITFSNAPAVKTFVSQTATRIVVKVPMGVLRGNVSLAVKNSTLKVQSPVVLEITGDVPPPTISFPIYNDAVTSNWNGWTGNGWGGTKDLNNTSPVREGTKSVKINYEGSYGSPLQLGGANVNIAPYTTFKISIYGAPGSGGKKVNIGINGKDAHIITVVEGKWTDYEIPLSSLTTESALTEILVKEFSDTGGFTIYVDALGLN